MNRRMVAAVAAAALAVVTGISWGAPSRASAAPPAGHIPPNLAADQWAAKFPAAAADARAMAARLKAEGPPVNPVYQTAAATGPELWGGHMWSAPGNEVPPALHGCSGGVNTMTSVGTRYLQDAGHCFRAAGQGAYFIDPTTGTFTTGWPTPTGPQIGHAGAVANWSNAAGDNAWIRNADDAAPGGTFSEMAVFDSRGAVNAVCACDPVVGEAASISMGRSASLLRGGVITQVNITSNFGAPVNAVTNQAQFRTDATHFGCVQAGDSGSPVIGPNHEFLGTVSGSLVSTPWCFVAFDMGRKSMVKVAQTLAPSDPTAS